MRRMDGWRERERVWWWYLFCVLMYLEGDTHTQYSLKQYKIKIKIKIKRLKSPNSFVITYFHISVDTIVELLVLRVIIITQFTFLISSKFSDTKIYI